MLIFARQEDMGTTFSFLTLVTEMPSTVCYHVFARRSLYWFSINSKHLFK